MEHGKNSIYRQNERPNLSGLWQKVEEWKRMKKGACSPETKSFAVTRYTWLVVTWLMVLQCLCSTNSFIFFSDLFVCFLCVCSQVLLLVYVLSFYHLGSRMELKLSALTASATCWAFPLVLKHLLFYIVWPQRDRCDGMFISIALRSQHRRVTSSQG